MTLAARAFLGELFEAAVAAAHPSLCLPPHLPAPPEGRVIILAAGKAAGSMAEVAENFYTRHHRLDAARLRGIAVTRHGYARPTKIVEMIEASHPVPDETGLQAAARTLAMATDATADDLVLILVSGGASANWVAPASGLSLPDKQALTRALLRSGATIGEINIVRKHLSRIKGGRLARCAHPARVVTVAISDVPGDDPASIGSGPSVPDPSTLSEARAVLTRHAIEISDNVRDALTNPTNETPKPGDSIFEGASFVLAGRPSQSFQAVQQKVSAAGYECIFLGDRVEGEARDVAAQHAQLAGSIADQGRRAVILSGGELTVTLRGKGRGGPNQEYALALALALAGRPGVTALAADTDGTDGGGGDHNDPAGAFLDATSIARARELRLDPAVFLAENNSTPFFTALNDLLSPGPTFTNVNDFRAILIDSP